jgi:hypothetical protein
MPANLELRNLTVSSAVGLYAEQGHKLTLVNTTSGFLKINNGGSLQATNIVVTDVRQGWGIWVNDGSSAAISGNVTVRAVAGNNGIVAAGGSRVVFENAAIVVSPTSGTLNWGVYNEENADLTFKSSTITFPSGTSLPVYVRGRTTFYSSGITLGQTTANMILLEAGGYLSLNGGTYGAGVPATNGVNDNGASGVTGTGIIRATTNCWTGTQFLQSNSGNGALSGVRANDGTPGMSASTEVSNNSAVAANNAQRGQLRATNTSNFTCQM